MTRALLWAGLVVAAVVGLAVYQVTRTVGDLLLANERLRDSLANLSAEGPMGRAVVVEQGGAGPERRTRLHFREIGPGGELGPVREVRLRGDVGYFEGVVFAVAPEVVADGKGRAAWLWRRVFDEFTAPAAGQELTEEGRLPGSLDRALVLWREPEKARLAEELWDLSHDARGLNAVGFRAVHGVAVKQQFRLGYRYTFILTAPGQVVVEAEPLP